MDQTQEVGRLRGDLEKKTHLYEEELARREAQHSNELKALRKELRDAEGQHLAIQKEILVLKDKLEKTRRERYLFFMSFSHENLCSFLWCWCGGVSGTAALCMSNILAVTLFLFSSFSFFSSDDCMR